MLVCRTESAMQPLSGLALVRDSTIGGFGRFRFIHADVSANMCKHQNVVSTHRQLHLGVLCADSAQPALTNSIQHKADCGTKNSGNGGA